MCIYSLYICWLLLSTDCLYLFIKIFAKEQKVFSLSDMSAKHPARFLLISVQYLFLVVEIFLLLVFYCNFSLKLLIFSWINCTWRQKLFLVPQQCHNWNFYFPMRIKELNWHPEAIVKLTSHFLLTLISFSSFPFIFLPFACIISIITII